MMKRTVTARPAALVAVAVWFAAMLTVAACKKDTVQAAQPEQEDVQPQAEQVAQEQPVQDATQESVVPSAVMSPAGLPIGRRVFDEPVQVAEGFWELDIDSATKTTWFDREYLLQHLEVQPDITAQVANVRLYDEDGESLLFFATGNELDQEMWYGNYVEDSATLRSCRAFYSAPQDDEDWLFVFTDITTGEPIAATLTEVPIFPGIQYKGKNVYMGLGEYNDVYVERLVYMEPGKLNKDRLALVRNRDAKFYDVPGLAESYYNSYNKGCMVYFSKRTATPIKYKDTYAYWVGHGETWACAEDFYFQPGTFEALAVEDVMLFEEAPAGATWLMPKDEGSLVPLYKKADVTSSAETLYAQDAGTDVARVFPYVAKSLSTVQADGEDCWWYKVDYPKEGFVLSKDVAEFPALTSTCTRDKYARDIRSIRTYSRTQTPFETQLRSYPAQDAPVIAQADYTSIYTIWQTNDGWYLVFMAETPDNKKEKVAGWVHESKLHLQ